MSYWRFSRTNLCSGEKEMTNKLDELLKFDALQEAEKQTGVSYKDTTKGEGFDNPATALGFLLMRENAMAKEEILTELGDTTFNNDLDRYQSIIEKYGFEKVLEDDFIDPHNLSNPDETKYEKYFIYAHRQKGLLLAFD